MAVKTWRSRRYLAWVRAQACAISRTSPAGDAHHIKGHGFGGTTKSCDLLAIPLTREEHTRLHQIGWRQWEEQHHVDQRTLALRLLERAVEEGVIDVCKDI